ncbi:porin family protein [Flavobacterium sp.]|uniref:porin family protein n=1 Tax=Flavobacterium sp. TaxID=239 RepID=UPI0039E2CC38
MKKIFFAALAVVAFGVSNAQEIKFGVKGGVGASTFSGNVDDAEAKFAGHLGGFAEFKFKKFAVQPELLVSYIGAEWNHEYDDFWYGEGAIDNVQYQANLLYLHIPIMAKYYVIDPLSIDFGPQIGVLLDAEYKMETTFWNDRTESHTRNAKDDVKPIDFGLNLGATYNFKNNMFVSGRYTLGLTNIDDMQPEPGDKKADAKNQVFQVSFGYKF